MHRLTFFYMTAFAAFTVGDALSTFWAFIVPGTVELNAAAATDIGRFHLERMVLINVIFLALTAPLIEWALRHRDRIEPRYLSNPSRAFLNLSYLNPFAARNMPLSVFQALAIAPAALGMKLVAIVNNCMVAIGLPALTRPLFDTIAPIVGSTAWIFVILALLGPVWWLALKATASTLRRQGQQPPAAA